MTKWQESCIIALASSPMAWEIFKMKQRNKKPLWQYINRIWPYHKTQQDHQQIAAYDAIIGTFLKLYNELLDVTEETIKPEYSVWVDLTVVFDLLREKKIVLPDRSMMGGNNFCQLTFTNNVQDSLTTRRCANKDSLLVACSSILSNESDMSYPHLCKIIVCRNICQFTEMLTYFLQDIMYIVDAAKKKQTALKCNKDTYNWLNIGIEIEHFAENPTSTKVHKQILLQNCRDYDSGFDGDNELRLRENRIRLDGIHGLKGLYTLLTDMKKHCYIAENSSVHFHVDCKYDSSFLKGTFFKHVSFHDRIQLLGNDLFDTAISVIFDTPEYTKNCVPNTQFHTCEYRFGIPNFTYSDYVIQILTVIHLTECIKHECGYNIAYLRMLGNVAKELRNKNKQKTLLQGYSLEESATVDR